MVEPWPSHGLAMAELWPGHGRGQTIAEPWLGHGQPKYFPFMEAATAADLTSAFEPGLRRPRQRPTKRGSGGRSPPAKPDLTLTCMKGHVLGSALSHDPINAAFFDNSVEGPEAQAHWKLTTK